MSINDLIKAKKKADLRKKLINDISLNRQYKKIKRLTL